MLPFIGRPRRPKRARSHRNTASAQYVNMVGLKLLRSRGGVLFLGYLNSVK
jgi:hypothetical protein